MGVSPQALRQRHLALDRALEQAATDMIDAGTIATFDPSKDTGSFRGALGTFVTGVTVVTASSDEGPVGIVANSFASVSLDPPLVLWSPAKSSKRFHHFSRSQHFAVHVLSAQQRDLCAGVARSKTAINQFDLTTNLAGVPLLGEALATFECDMHAVHDAGDHVIVVGLVTRCSHRDGDPLVFQGGKYGRFNET